MKTEELVTLLAAGVVPEPANTVSRRFAVALGWGVPGAVLLLVYALRCPESTVPLLAVWYVLGIAIPTLAGAMLGSRVLRW